MQRLDVDIPEENRGGAYPIHIGAGILSAIGEIVDFGRFSTVAVVTDANVRRPWGRRLRRALPVPSREIVIPAGEAGKSPRTVERVWGRLQRLGCDRHSLVINLGGGLVGDLGGFAASTFMRGLTFIQMPTTLLAQVDASVGGKLGVNFAGVKNLVGVFKQPAAVIIDVETLDTLPARELMSGFAEVLKHGLIRDRAYFEEAAGLCGDALDAGVLERVVRRSCEIKAAVVSADEREAGPRKILNFGHTAGHAAEILSHEKAREPGAGLLHGEAVALGMRCAARLSVLKGLLAEAEAESIGRALDNFALPRRLPAGISRDEILNRLCTDKKNVGGKERWTLLRGIGEAVFAQEAERGMVEEALTEIVG